MAFFRILSYEKRLNNLLEVFFHILICSWNKKCKGMYKERCRGLESKVIYFWF